MKTTVLVFVGVILVLCAGLLFEQLRRISTLGLLVSGLVVLGSMLALWTILPAQARYGIEKRASAARVVIKSKVVEIAGTWSADAPRLPAAVPPACKKNEFYSRISKACVPEWNIKTR